MPVHDRTLYVRLSCGHERVSRGWRGEVGESYCCDVCRRVVSIEKVEATFALPSDWHVCQRSAWPSPPVWRLQADVPVDRAAQIRWGLDYIRQNYGHGWDVWRPRWRGRRRLVVQLGRLRVRVIWRWL